MSLRVFVTGAAGSLGSAIAARLAQSGCDVLGQVRAEERATGLEALGVRPVMGDLTQRGEVLSHIKNCDAVVHAAAQPGAGAARFDQAVLELIQASVVDGRVRHVLYTSDVWVHGDTGERIEDETATPRPASIVSWRPAHEDVALDLVDHEAHVAVVRPAIVYGGSEGLLADWFREAREARTVTYAGDGSQHWSMVHIDDLAEGYRLALEHARGGQRYILADESHLTVREIAEAVARVTGAQARPWAREALIEQLGPLGEALLLDQRVTAARARRTLGWVPRHTNVVTEIESLHREWLSGQATPVA